MNGIVSYGYTFPFQPWHNMCAEFCGDNRRQARYIQIRQNIDLGNAWFH